MNHMIPGPPPNYRAIYALYPSYADIGIRLKYSSLSDEVEL